MTAEQPESKPQTSLVVGASWLLTSKICSFAITTALPLILVRRLSKTEFGYYKQLFLILQSAMNLLPFGMNMSLFYFIPRARTRAEKGNIVLGVIIFYLITTGALAGCLILIPGFLGQLFRQSSLVGLGPQIGFTIVPYILSSLLEFVLIADGNTRLSALSTILINTVRTALILGAALIWGNIGAILWCVFAVAILHTLVLLFYVAKSYGEFWKSFRWNVLWSQISYALPLGAAGLIWALQVDIDNYFVTHFFDAATFAIYATGCFDVPLVGMLGDSVGAVLIPRISSLQSSHSLQEIISVTVKAIRGLAFAYAPVFVFVFLAANQVITVLFRADYLASVPIFRVNLLMVLLAIVAVDPIMRAFKSERFWMLRMNIVLLAVLAVALYFATTRVGLIGAVTCVIAVQYLLRGLVVWRVSKLLHLQWHDLRPLTDVLKTLLAAAVAGLCVAPLLQPIQQWGALTSLLVCGMLYCCVYILGLFLLKVPAREETEWCWRLATDFIQTRLSPVFRRN